MRILVTGSLGTLGRPLVRELRGRGHVVFGCDLVHGPAEGHVRADIAEYRQLQRAFECARPDYVFNLAAEFGRHNGRDYPEQCWRTNCLGMRNVIELCHAWDARLVHASSSEIYGELPEDGAEIHESIAEERALRPTNDYAITKLANELQCRTAMDRQPIMVLRFFNAYGPGEHYHPYRSVVALFCHRLLMGLPVDVYEGYHRVFMFICDFIPTLANAVDGFTAGTFVNIGGTEYRSVEDLVQLVLEHTGAKPNLVRRLPFEEHNVRNKRPSIERARHMFGHNPKVLLEEGVQATVQWMRDMYLPVAWTSL